MAPVENSRMSIARRKSKNLLGTSISAGVWKRYHIGKIRMVKRRVISLRERNAALIQTNEGLIKESAGYKELLKRFQSDIERYSSRNAELTSTMARLMDENAKMREVIMAFKNDMNAVVRQAGELSASLNGMRTDLNVRMTPRVSGASQELMNSVASSVASFGNERKRKAQAAVGPMIRGQQVFQPKILIRRVDLTIVGGRNSENSSSTDESSEEDDISEPATTSGSTSPQSQSTRPPESENLNTTRTTVWEPVVRLRDVSRLINNSSFITIPEVLNALESEENRG